MVLVIVLIMSSCSLDPYANPERPGGGISSINIWKDTPAWDLAHAVRNQNTNKIKKLCQDNPELINYSEPTYEATLLIWSVGLERYNSAKTLLELGADPNLCTKYGETALFIASEFSWVNYLANEDPKFVKLLLSYNADPNICYKGGDPHDNVTSPGTSPLMISINRGIEKTKALVEGGADINHRTESGNSAVIIALLQSSASTAKRLEYARYLIVEKKAKVTEPYKAFDVFGTEHTFYPVDYLDNWDFDVGTDEYNIKMEIVKEFKNQGVEYIEKTDDTSAS